AGIPHQAHDGQSARPHHSAVAAAASGSGARMNRRAFVTGLGALFAAPLASDAQPPNKLWRIGVLAQPPGLAIFLGTFREGLRELGYTENRNIVIDTREGEFRELPGLANDLLRNHPDLLVTVYSAATVAAKQATSTTPILFVDVADPVAIEVVASLARPGGNV